MKKTTYILLAAFALSSCNYLEIDPVGQVIPHKTTEFRALLTEGYFRFPYTDSKTYTGMLSDEVGFFYEKNLYSGSDALALSYNYTWQYNGRQMYELPYDRYYRAIFQANAVIADVMNAEQDSTEPREQILGEAYALRAYSHFDLVNLYGQPYDAATADTDRGVPLYTQIDIEQKFRPTTVARVYAQILSDISEAERLISVEKQSDATLNYRFSQHALTAFKARVMLYMGNWQEALTAAASLIPKYELVDLNGLEDKPKLPWKGTSPECILGWERPFGGGGGDLLSASLLSDGVLSLLDAENDNRRTYLRKKEILDKNSEVVYSGYVLSERSSSDRMSIRIAEMYLIAAEAGAHLSGGLDDAKTRLLTLQARRLKPEAMEAQRTKVEAMDAEALLTEIADENAREFLLEGHRWQDLRRTTRPRITKTHNEQTYVLNAGDSRYTLPFPQSAIDANPELGN